MNRSEHFKHVRRVVAKIGTSLLADPGKGVNEAMVEKLASEVQALRKDGLEVILVTSGAIGLGMSQLRMKARPKSIPAKQATAAVGQPVLMEHYRRAFARHGVQAAQVLLTRQDLENRQRYLNARNTLETLLEMGVVPVINENDTVAVEEIKFGDNDNLAALVTNLCQAHLLVILTDVEGLYDEDPRVNPGARLVPEVAKVNRALEQKAGGVGSLVGTGGMITKIQAAKTVTMSGEMMVIAKGSKPQILPRILAGRDEGTLFLASGRPLDSHKRWIAFTLKPKGSLTLDQGATLAVQEKGKSLLPSGLERVSGHFGAGEVVRLVGCHGEDLGLGLCHYSSEECARLKGAKSSEIEMRLGYKVKDELVHRDDMVLMGMLKEP